jgi:UDP-N-acetylglucosamine 2-epimerase
MRILSVIGTRPEAIKMASVVAELRRHPRRVKSIIVSTGQHREMLDQMLGLFQIHVDYDLDLMKQNQSLAGLTAALLEGLDQVVGRARPDWVLAQGDTTTAMVAGLVAFYHGVKFGHVEAGLRTGDKHRPFPEETNRRIADLVADIYFAPTPWAKANLLREGCPAAAIHVTGNTVIDALQEIAARPFKWTKSAVASVPEDKRLVLITAHRRESFGPPFRKLCFAIRDLAKRYAGDNTHFVYPVHLNPNVRAPVQEILQGINNVTLVEPLDYLTMVHLMKRAALILTDSGGVQEEAPTFGVPVLVMRDTTERPEGVEAGCVKLVGTNRKTIVTEASRALENRDARKQMCARPNPYGDGQAARRIVKILLEQ